MRKEPHIYSCILTLAAALGLSATAAFGQAAAPAQPAKAVAPAVAPARTGAEIPQTRSPATPYIQAGDRVAIVGDSITEQRMYSRFIELYLRACHPQLNVDVLQLGWSGERASGLNDRMENDLMPWKPTLVTLCYGMNDGSYKPYQPKLGDDYRAAMENVLTRLQKAGARVVVGSPGCVDSVTFKRPGNIDPAAYNDTLAHLRDIASDLAANRGLAFANVHDTMLVAMEPAKERYGRDYQVVGGDGVHPQPNGHLPMAYAFLKGMGLDGNIGTFTFEFEGGATATEGHTVLSWKEGKGEIESARWPFCFEGQNEGATSPRNVTAMLPYVPFNKDLNRLTLVVKNLPTEKAKVKWGSHKKEFTREQLEAGVNLAEAFLENPFSAPFKALNERVGEKQKFETVMVKSFVTNARAPEIKEDPEIGKLLGEVRTRLEGLREKQVTRVREAFKPVRHTVEIEPVK